MIWFAAIAVLIVAVTVWYLARPLARLAAMHEAHRHLPVPDVLRRPIGLQRRA